MVQKTVRLPRVLLDRTAKEMRSHGFTSLSAFIRIALQNELDGREAEERLASTMERLARELRRLDTTHQAEFAFLDALARVMLHCLPEPPADIRDQTIAKAKERHQKLLKIAAANMQGDAQADLTELMKRAV